MKARPRRLVTLLLLLSACTACAQAPVQPPTLPVPGLTFSLTPGFAVTLGPGADYFSWGGVGELLAEYPFATVPGLSVRGGIGYGLSALQFATATTSEISALAGAAWGFPLAGPLSAMVFAGAGYSYGFINGDSLSQGGGSALLEAGAGLSYGLNPLFALRLEASYTWYVGVHGTLNVSLGTAFSLPQSTAPTLPNRPSPLAGAAAGQVAWSNPKGLAAYVQPDDRAVRDLAGLASDATARLYSSGMDRNVQVAIAILAAAHAQGVVFAPDTRAPYSRVSLDPDGSGPVRLPGQTLRSRGADQPDLVVLYASLFESLGVETAILTVPGRMLLGVRLRQDPAGAASSLRGLPGIVVRDGVAWLPLDLSAKGGGLPAAWDAGARAWAAASTEAGAGANAGFVSVREARAASTPVAVPSPASLSAPPSTDIVARAFVQGLASLMDQRWNAAAVARRPVGTSTAPDSGAAAPRRIYLSVDSGTVAGYSRLDAASVEKSIAFALRGLGGFIVIEGEEGQSAEGLDAAARAVGADSWLRAEISGQRSAPAIHVRLFDVPRGSMLVDRVVQRDADLGGGAAAGENWQDLVSAVSEAFPSLGAAGATGPAGPRAATARDIVLTVHARPGTTVRGVPGGPVVVEEGGAANITLAGGSALSLRAELAGFFPVERSLLVDASRDLYLPQNPQSPFSIETSFQDSFSPSAAAVISLKPELFFLKLGATSYLFGLALDETQAFSSVQLWTVFLQAGIYVLPVGFPIRPYAGLGPFIRVAPIPGSALRLDPLSPGGLQAALGAEVRAGSRARLFVEYSPTFYLSPSPSLFAQSFPSGKLPKGYISTSIGGLSLLEMRFGVRWQL